MTIEEKPILEGLVPHKQACKELNCSKTFLWRERNKANGLIAVKIGRHLYYRREELQALVDRKLAAAKTNPARQ